MSSPVSRSQRTADAEASETAFLSCIGLDVGLKEDEKAYDIMKRDAAASRAKICNGGRECLLPTLRNDVSVQAPYAYEQITEVALAEEVRHMYRTAQAPTRKIYDSFGKLEDHDVATNWIIRWMLWHEIESASKQSNGTV